MSGQFHPLLSELQQQLQLVKSKQFHSGNNTEPEDHKLAGLRPIQPEQPPDTCLSQVTIAIVGLGRVGRALCDILARSGVANLLVCDIGIVRECDLITAPFTQEHVGMNKVQAMRMILQGITKVSGTKRVIGERLDITNEHNAEAFVAMLKSYNCRILCCCSNNPKVRESMNNICLETSLPLFSLRMALCGVTSSGLVSSHVIVTPGSSACLECNKVGQMSKITDLTENECVYPENVQNSDNVEVSKVGLGHIPGYELLQSSIIANSILKYLESSEGVVLNKRLNTSMKVVRKERKRRISGGDQRVQESNNSFCEPFGEWSLPDPSCNNVKCQTRQKEVQDKLCYSLFGSK